jgi:hypothetical protein
LAGRRLGFEDRLIREYGYYMIIASQYIYIYIYIYIFFRSSLDAASNPNMQTAPNYGAVQHRPADLAVVIFFRLRSVPRFFFPPHAACRERCKDVLQLGRSSHSEVRLIGQEHCARPWAVRYGTYTCEGMWNNHTVGAGRHDQFPLFSSRKFGFRDDKIIRGLDHQGNGGKRRFHSVWNWQIAE